MRHRHLAFGIALLSCVLLALPGCPPGGGVSTTIEQLEQASFDGVNDERVDNGLAALTMRADLRSVARAHSQDMAARDFFDHTNPDGEGLDVRLANAGIGYRLAGENIAWNNFPNPADTAVTGWMNSAGHRANILTAEFTHTGMGVASDGAGGFYFTQVFVQPPTKNGDGPAYGTITRHTAP